MFRFNFDKAMQALALMLRQPGKDRHKYLKVLKLLYIAEKEALLETGRPLTGDRLSAMPHGPVLSHICDLMRGEDIRPGWADHFRTTGYQIEALKDPGTDLLSKYEVEKIVDVARRHAERTRWEVRDLTHEFPEWGRNDPGQSSREIPLEHVLEAGGKPEMKERIERAAEADRAFEDAFGA